MFPAEAPKGTTPPGSLHLFEFRGIRVSLHWSWALVAAWQIQSARGFFPNIGWDIAIYVTFFGIVLLHEFGHAFAARQVGGTADHILLWPFGGIAYVKTPPRPKAYLWSIAAGPLVNVALWPVLYALTKPYGDPFNFGGTYSAGPDGRPVPAGMFLFVLFYVNTLMLVFNLLPIYPMDGGQMLRGLLWFKVGPVRSIYIAAWTSLVVGGAVILYALLIRDSVWMAVIVGLTVFEAWGTIRALNAWRAQNGGRW
jgi:Zn-dependent protease